MEVWKKSLFALGGLLGLWLLALLIASSLPWSREGSRAPLRLEPDQDAEDFFRAYWQRPIPPQGSPPASFTEGEAALSPEACGGCHAQQYTDWKESLHSRSMGPGPWGQIIDFQKNSPDQAVLCQTCHAPLTEQMAFIKADDGGESAYQKNPHFDPKLQLKGITCAACHVRQHQRFGPPKAERAPAGGYPPGLANHNGVQRTPHFEKAEFCRDCHQFDPENTLLVINGKPIQDTYREWKESLWGQSGAGCQECHMPKRRHFWKGIHDPEWVRGGVRVEVQLAPSASSPHAPLELTVEVVNAAVGHKFPTYITPKVFVRAALLDRGGKPLPETRQERVIGWDARFVDGEWKEYFDTRIPPGKSLRFSFRWRLSPSAKKIRAWVEVHPDHFYHVHFYPVYLKDENLSPEGKKLIERALKESGRTSYILFEKIISLDGPPPS